MVRRASLRQQLLSWTTARRLTALAFLVLLGGAFGTDVFRGTTAGSEVFAFVPLVDPLAAIEVMIATRELQWTLVIGAALLIGFAVFFGPVFCGWVCPLGLVLDLNDSLRRRVARLLARRGRELPEYEMPRRTRSAVIGLFLGLALVWQLPVFQALSPIHALAWAVSLAAGPGLVVVALLLVVEWFAPRLWCRSLCPVGALYSTVGAKSPFGVQIDPEKAGLTPCSLCTLHCPMGIRVMEDYSLVGAEQVDDRACSRCGSCIDACPSGVLRLGVGGKRRKRAAVAPRIRERGPQRRPRTRKHSDRSCELPGGKNS